MEVAAKPMPVAVSKRILYLVGVTGSELSIAENAEAGKPAVEEFWL